MLCFVFVNGATGYVVSARWRAWVNANILNLGLGRGAFVVTSLTISVVLLAYVLSSLSTFLRQLLEGRWWWEILAKRFVAIQKQHREALLDSRNEAFANLTDLREMPQWRKDLIAARNEGIKKNPNLKLGPPAPDAYDKQLADFEDSEIQNKVIPAEKLQKAVEDLSALLKTHNVDEDTYLDKHQQRLLEVLKYANDRAQAEYSKLLNELHTSFGGNEIEPTKMGNIANTIQSYALRRYQCNLEAIWSNLQRVVQRDEKANAALQESKTQLDFLVACSWLTLAWSAIWTIVFSIIVPSRIGFFGAALGGPAISYLWYRVAAEQYRSFADVSMTTLDSFRFALLEEMRLATPYDVENERYVWQSLDQLTTYQEQKNFRYIKPASQQ